MVRCVYVRGVDRRLTELTVSPTTVVDLRVLEALGIASDALQDGWDRALSQVIGEAALDRGAEAILVPSASRLGDNLMILPDNLALALRVATTHSLYHVLRY